MKLSSDQKRLPVMYKIDDDMCGYDTAHEDNCDELLRDCPG